MSHTIVVLEGDETGQELLEEALRVLDPSVTGVEVAFQRFDLGLENRRATRNQVVQDAADAMLQSGLGLKAATITPETKGDVGSPNAILRERVDGTVIDYHSYSVLRFSGKRKEREMQINVYDSNGKELWTKTVGADGNMK